MTPQNGPYGESHLQESGTFVTCVECGRRGTRSFVPLSTHDDRVTPDQVICANRKACQRRQRRLWALHEQDRKAATRDRCAVCQAVTDAGKPTTCPECPERIRQEQKHAAAQERIRAACRWSPIGPVM